MANCNDFTVGNQRQTRAGVTWTIVRELPHVNGDPAYVRARSDSGRERTIHYAAWLRMRKVGGTP